MKPSTPNDQRAHRQTDPANQYDQFELAISGVINNIMVQVLNSDGTTLDKYMTDTGAKRDLFPVIARSIFHRIAETPPSHLVSPQPKFKRYRKQ